MTIIRKYYIAPFIGFLLLFVLTALVRKSPNTIWQNILICLVGALTLSVLIGTFSYFQNTKWGPAQRQKSFFKSPFVELFANGFTRHDDVAVGIMRGYTVIVAYEWSTGKASIKLEVLFDIGLSAGMADDSLMELRKRNKPANWLTGQPYEWTRNSIGCTFQFNFTPPSSEKLVKKAEELIDLLKRERLNPMSLENALDIQATQSFKEE